MRHPFLAVLACGVLACNGGDDDPIATIDAAGGAIDAPGGALPLNAGPWGYASYNRTSDTCGGQVDGDGDFTVDLVTATSFRIVRERTPPSACTINASDFFDCTTPDEIQDRRPTFDAVFRASLDLDGHITTPTLASGMQTIRVSCTGTECADAAPITLPCSVVAQVAISRR